jgi:1,2-dihydroxy-3-keto-5-methylthiopentene dioxygenase
MAVLRFPEETLERREPGARIPREAQESSGGVAAGPGDSYRTIGDEVEIRAELGALGVEYERWSLDRVPPDSSADTVLTAYADEIEEMKRRGGYVTADVIDVNAATPGLETMLAKFDKEHTHSEDEVRFILAGRGIFFLHLGEGVVAVEVGPGDLLRVPRGTKHWFTLCEDRRIRAIRWFQFTSGWTPQYTGSGVDQGYEPVCFGPAYLGPRVATGAGL